MYESLIERFLRFTKADKLEKALISKISLLLNCKFINIYRFIKKKEEKKYKNSRKINF